MNAQLWMGSGGGFSTQGTQIRPDGTFTINGLTPGDYTLFSSVPSGGDMATANVTVGDSDVTDVQLVVAKQSIVRGRVLVDDSAAPPKASTLRLYASPTSNSMFMGGGGNVQVKDDYTFEMKLRPGRFVIRLQGGAGDWRLHAVRWNGAEVTDAGIDVMDATVSDVAVEISTRQAEVVSGKVVDEAGLPARDYWVVLFPQDPRLWDGRSRFVTAARSDSDGKFKVRLPGGAYYAVAMQEVEDGSWSDPDLLTVLREHATPLSVADGEKATLDLKLSPPVVY